MRTVCRYRLVRVKDRWKPPVEIQIETQLAEFKSRTKVSNLSLNRLTVNYSTVKFSGSAISRTGRHVSLQPPSHKAITFSTPILDPQHSQLSHLSSLVQRSQLPVDFFRPYNDRLGMYSILNHCGQIMPVINQTKTANSAGNGNPVATAAATAAIITAASHLATPVYGPAVLPPPGAVGRKLHSLPVS